MIGAVSAAEITSDVLYLLVMQVLAEGEISQDEMVIVLKSCEKKNKKLWVQCGEVAEKLWGTEKEESKEEVEEETKTEKKEVETTRELKEVIDGDTIKVSENGADWITIYSVRMIWLDAPESSTTRYGYIEEYGEEAKEHLKQLLKWKKISLEFDETQGTEDKYWRRLAYVIVNGENINKQMIEDGYGWEYTYNLPYKYQDEFKKAQKTAELKNNGLRDPKIAWWKRIKDWEITDKISSSSSNYWQGSSSNYSNYSSSSSRSSGSSSPACAGHFRETGPRGWCYYQEWSTKVYDTSKVCCR